MTLLSQPNSDQYPTAMQNIGGKNENVYDPLLQYNVSQLQRYNFLWNHNTLKRNLLLMFPFLFGLYQFINAFNRNTPSIIKYTGTIKQGLSLIVVNDGRPHTLVSLSLRRCLFRLNPCYAGRCSSTVYWFHAGSLDLDVSILVMLDNALVLRTSSI